MIDEMSEMIEDLILDSEVRVIIKMGEGVDLLTHLDKEGNLQSILLRSDDFKEGTQAHMEGRKPEWKRS